MSEDNKLYCKICEKTFSNVSALNKHLKTASHLQNELNKEQNKEIEKVEAGKGKIKIDSVVYCPLCDYTSNKLENFRNHTVSKMHEKNKELLLDYIKKITIDYYYDDKKEINKTINYFIIDIEALKFKIGLIKKEEENNKKKDEDESKPKQKKYKYEEVSKENVISDFIDSLNLKKDEILNLEIFFNDTLKKREYPEHIEKSEKDEEKIKQDKINILKQQIEGNNKIKNTLNNSIKKLKERIITYDEISDNLEKLLKKLKDLKIKYNEHLDKIDNLGKGKEKAYEVSKEDIKKESDMQDEINDIRYQIEEITKISDPKPEIKKKEEQIKQIEKDNKIYDLKIKILNGSEEAKEEYEAIKEQEKKQKEQEKKQKEEKEKVKKEKKKSKKEDEKESKSKRIVGIGKKELKIISKREKEMRENEEEFED